MGKGSQRLHDLQLKYLNTPMAWRRDPGDLMTRHNDSDRWVEGWVGGWGRSRKASDDRVFPLRSPLASSASPHPRGKSRLIREEKSASRFEFCLCVSPGREERVAHVAHVVVQQHRPHAPAPVREAPPAPTRIERPWYASTAMHSLPPSSHSAPQTQAPPPAPHPLNATDRM